MLQPDEGLDSTEDNVLVLDSNERNCNQYLVSRLQSYFHDFSIIDDESGEGELKYSRFYLSKEDFSFYYYSPSNSEQLTGGTIMQEIDTASAGSGEGKLLKEAKAPNSRAQLIAKMIKTASESLKRCKTFQENLNFWNVSRLSG